VATKDNAQFPQIRLEIWDAGQSARTIMLMLDSDEWVFVQKGHPYGFEDLRLYGHRIRKNRFSRKAAIDYMASAGLDLMDKQFWKSRQIAIYYEETTKKN